MGACLNVRVRSENVHSTTSPVPTRTDIDLCYAQGMAQFAAAAGAPLRPPGEGAAFMPAFAQKGGLHL